MAEPVVEGQGPHGTQDLGRLLDIAHTRPPSLPHTNVPLVSPHYALFTLPPASCSLEPTRQMSNDGEAESESIKREG